MAGIALKSALSASTKRADRYEIGEVIASGGMGTVYRAFDRLAQRPVAYKRLRPREEPARPRLAALFQREYDTLTHLRHPNIVEAYDYGFDAAGPYYTMELLPVADLAKLAPLAPNEACRLLRDVASALALLHARRLVHRDVSPHNVCLAHDGRAKLIDFGGLTPFGKPSEVVGTPPFVAPECVQGGPLDQRSDLYALGALAYHLLTRRAHLRARHMEDLLDAQHAIPAPPSELVPAIPRALDDLVMSLLQPEPAARPESAAHVIERLTRIAQLEPEQEEERVAFSYLQRPHLVGREEALSCLRKALDSALHGEGKIVWIEAEQGLGRSALLEHIAVETQMAGASVLRAGAGLHTGPFSAAEALTREGLALFPAAGAALQRSGSMRLDAALDKERPSKTAVDASERQAALALDLQSVLLSLCEQSPLALLVDDAHGVDPESIAWLASMVELIPAYPILLVLSVEKGAASLEPRARYRLEHVAERVELRALTKEETGKLVSTMFGDVPNSSSLSAWLFAQTAGNPAHSVDLARLLLAQGKIRYTLGTFTLPYELAAPVVDDHQRALLARLAQVGPVARALAALLCLHRGALSAETLAHAHGCTTAEVLLALEELAQRGALVSHAEHYACASEALRASVCSTLTEDEKSTQHLALGRALARTGDTSIEAVCAVTGHLLCADPEQQREAAATLAREAAHHVFELGMQPARLGPLEHALTVLAREGLGDRDCVALLVPLSISGFFGDFEMLRRYIGRTLGALSEICGLTLAHRLRRVFGPRLSLACGLSIAFLMHLARRRGFGRSSFVEHLEWLAGVAGTAAAAAACAFDAQEANRVSAALEPLAVAPRRSPLFFMREFCLATAELVNVKLKRAAERYTQLVQVYEHGVIGMSPRHRAQARCGSLNGLAQTLVSDASPEALYVAERLERDGGGPFYAPHVENVRAAYHAYRGEARAAAFHRARAEALALRSGTCWSATSVLTVRMVLPCVMTGDVIGLVRVVSDLEQLAQLSPSLAALHQLALAHLSVLRGEHEKALTRYEQVFAGPVARALPTYAAERSMQVDALVGLGEHARARALGLSIVAELDAQDEGAARNDFLFCIPRMKLALAEAHTGDFTRAAATIETCFQRGLTRDNPLLTGSLHGARARVSALAGDKAAFERHFAMMGAQFRLTGNANLMRECKAVEAEGIRLGVLAAPTGASGGDELAPDAQTILERPVSSRPGAKT